MSRQNSYTYDELIACGNGEVFGDGNARLPAPPMLMFDRITKISDAGGAFDKGYMEAELDIHPDFGFSTVISKPIRSCPAVWGSTPCGSLSAFIWAGLAIRAAGGRLAGPLNSPAK